MTLIFVQYGIFQNYTSIFVSGTISETTILNFFTLQEF